MYGYIFDSTIVGDYRLQRPDFKLVQESLELLLTKLQEWNIFAFNNGAYEVPYSREFEDLKRMIDFGQEQLETGSASEIVFKGISISSYGYIKAAFIFAAWSREDEITKLTANGSLPPAVVESIRGKVRKLHELADRIAYEAAPILDELRPETRMSPLPSSNDVAWDVFISHASEDKEVLARALAERLRLEGLKVWYDEFTLQLGDSLRRSIDRGLAHSRFGVVILSPSFFSKEWPQKELDGLVAREVDGRKIILPVWHEVNSEDIRKFSPTLADRIAIASSAGIDMVVAAIVTAIE